MRDIISRLHVDTHADGLEVLDAKRLQHCCLLLGRDVARQAEGAQLGFEVGTVVVRCAERPRIQQVLKARAELPHPAVRASELIADQELNALPRGWDP